MSISQYKAGFGDFSNPRGLMLLVAAAFKWNRNLYRAKMKLDFFFALDTARTFPFLFSDALIKRNGICLTSARALKYYSTNSCRNMI